MVREWCIEQNFGPHIPQNSALLKYSAGKVSPKPEAAER
jgi:hypothetical protein